MNTSYKIMLKIREMLHLECVTLICKDGCEEGCNACTPLRKEKLEQLSEIETEIARFQHRISTQTDNSGDNG